MAYGLLLQKVIVPHEGLGDGQAPRGLVAGARVIVPHEGLGVAQAVVGQPVRLR